MRANEIKKGKRYRTWYGIVEVIEPNVFKDWGGWHHAFTVVSRDKGVPQKLSQFHLPDKTSDTYTEMVALDPFIAPSNLFTIEVDENGNNIYTKTQLEQQQKTAQKELRKQQFDQNVETLVNTLIGLGATHTTRGSFQTLYRYSNTPTGNKHLGICIPYQDIENILPTLKEVLDKQMKELLL